MTADAGRACVVGRKGERDAPELSDLACEIGSAAHEALQRIEAVAHAKLSRCGWHQLGEAGRAGRRERVGPKAALYNHEGPKQFGVEAVRLGRRMSGGLDSAIIASALPGRDVMAVNYFSSELGGDERSYARDAAAHLGLQLLEVEKPAPAFDGQALAEMAHGARPALNALDFEHDRDMAGRCQELGVDALLTGQGGDHVFFQAASPLIAADALGSGLGPRSLAVLARRTGRSAWSVLREAMVARLGPPAPKARPGHVSALGWEVAARQGVHPWLRDIEGLPPAKALQVACLAAAQALNGVSRRGAMARLRHPLLSQPVMELCLPIAVFDLTQGGHDRALARQAFADRLPASIVQRQGKGRLTSHYGRVIGSGISELRPLLLEGRLAERGLLNLQVLGRMLSLEHLAWRGGYGAIMTTAALELWVRSWEARLGTRPGLL